MQSKSDSTANDQEREAEGMFVFIVLGIWGILHIYAFWRMATIRWIRQRVKRRRTWNLAAAATVALWGAYPISRMLFGDGESAAIRILGWFIAAWIGVLFFLACALLAADAMTLALAAAGWSLRRLRREKAARLVSGRGSALRLGAAIVAATISVVALFQGLRPPIVVDYEVYMPGLPPERDGMVVVGISDLHLGSITGERWMTRLADRIVAMNPDLIVLAGDLIEGGETSEPRVFGPSFARLRAPLGVWAVLGNHDHFGNAEGTQKILEEAGCRVLRNGWAEAAPGLVIAGVEGRHAHRAPPPDEDARMVAETLAGRPPGATILVSHYPRVAIADAATSAGVGLMISGHTHGGQLWPFAYLSKRAFPLFEGRYDVDGMTVIVCRGTRFWGPPMRLWRPGEICRIRLRAARVPGFGPRARLERDTRSSAPPNKGRQGGNGVGPEIKRDRLSIRCRRRQTIVSSGCRFARRGCVSSFRRWRAGVRRERTIQDRDPI